MSCMSAMSALTSSEVGSSVCMPAERQHPLHELPRAARCALRRLDRPQHSARDARLAAVGGSALQREPGDLQVAHDHLQDVVEVVRDAAGQLADRFHLLRLVQPGFGFGAQLRFGFQRCGALAHALLEHLVHLLELDLRRRQRGFRGLALGDVEVDAAVSLRLAVGDRGRRGRGRRSSAPARRAG